MQPTHAEATRHEHFDEQPLNPGGGPVRREGMGREATCRAFQNANRAKTGTFWRALLPQYGKSVLAPSSKARSPARSVLALAGIGIFNS